MNPKVDAYLARIKQWKEESAALRAIILDCKLTEELKWGVPCYTLEDKNVVLIHGFKEYCAILFTKGTLMKDPKGILITQTENVQSARQLRFTSLGEITKLKATIKAYVKDAIAVQKSGAKVELKKTAEFNMPEELQRRLDEDLELKSAFEALTPGRQRGYLLYFSSAKQSATRESRIQKCVAQIYAGKGWNE